MNEAKENIHRESLSCRFEEEYQAIFWWQPDFYTLKEVVTERLRRQNLIRKHSALGSKAPMEYLKEKWLLTR